MLVEVVSQILPMLVPLHLVWITFYLRRTGQTVPPYIVFDILLAGGGSDFDSDLAGMNSNDIGYLITWIGWSGGSAIY